MSQYSRRNVLHWSIRGGHPLAANAEAGIAAQVKRRQIFALARHSEESFMPSSCPYDERITALTVPYPAREEHYIHNGANTKWRSLTDDEALTVGPTSDRRQNDNSPLAVRRSQFQAISQTGDMVLSICRASQGTCELLAMADTHSASDGLRSFHFKANTNPSGDELRYEDAGLFPTWHVRVTGTYISLQAC